MHKQGDIILVPMPYTDLTTSKKRPVLIISIDDYNNKTEDIIVTAITSNISKTYSIILTNNDLTDGNLLRTSCVRADKLYTLSQSIVIRKFGTVKEEFLFKVIENVKKLIEI